MIKASIISCVLHVGIILVMITQTSITPPKITNVGENIEVRILSEDRGTLTDPLKGNSLEDRKQIKKTTETPRRKSVDKMIEKKTIVEKPTEKKDIPLKSVEKPKKAEKQKIEKIEEKQIELKDDTIVEVAQSREKVENEIKETTDKKSITADNDSSDETSNLTNKEEVRGSENGNMGKDLVALSDGSYMAKHQGVKGLSFGFISSPEPDYPSLAKRLGFKDEMIIKVIMEFDSNGRLSDMKFIGDEDRFGFRNEVEKTINQWRLTSIKYNNMNVKMRFYKSFKFESLN